MSYYLDSFHKHPQPKRKKKTTFPSLYWLYVEAFQQLASSVLSFTACAMQVWKFSQRWKFKVFLGLFWEWVQLWASTWPQLPSISRTFKKSYSKKKKKKKSYSPCIWFFNCFLPKFYNVPIVYPVNPRPSLLQSILQPNTGREVVSSSEKLLVEWKPPH